MSKKNTITINNFECDTTETELLIYLPAQKKVYDEEPWLSDLEKILLKLAQRYGSPKVRVFYDRKGEWVTPLNKEDK